MTAPGGNIGAVSSEASPSGEDVKLGDVTRWLASRTTVQTFEGRSLQIVNPGHEIKSYEDNIGVVTRIALIKWN